MGYTLEQKVFEMGREQKRLIPVEDGKWVVPYVRSGYTDEALYDADGMMVSGERSDWSYMIVGPKLPVRHVLESSTKRAHDSREHYSRGSSGTALVSDQPFGAILTAEENGRERFGLHFVCARQVHKGELGRRPVIARPRFAREAHDAGRFDSELPLTRDRRRGYVCWARLDETAYLIGMGPEELVRRYFRFTHSEHPALDVVFADGLAKLHNKPPQAPTRFGADALPALFTRDPSTMWIRKGFACTALYLHHLGHVPEARVNASPRAESHSDAVAVSQ